jgi:hypothetical protein
VFISERALHPPDFSLDHALSDWPRCMLEIRCPCSPKVTLLPARLLSEQHGNRPDTVGEFGSLGWSGGVE